MDDKIESAIGELRVWANADPGRRAFKIRYGAKSRWFVRLYSSRKGGWQGCYMNTYLIDAAEGALASYGAKQ
jgi:hypothetical protein